MQAEAKVRAAALVFESGIGNDPEALEIAAREIEDACSGYEANPLLDLCTAAALRVRLIADNWRKKP